MRNNKYPGLHEGVTVLDDELTSAIRWDRPSILLAVFKSEVVRDEAQKLLAQTLQQRKQKLEPITITPGNYDVTLVMVNAQKKKETVFSISNLGRGGGRSRLNAFRALNLRREIIVENSLRAVFWLTEVEARQLARHAPDFWAFRHRLVSLEE